jgi:hypothetical protein
MRPQDIKDDVEEERERWARWADERAEEYEKQIAGIPQRRTLPEPQLSKLKADHWRIIAKVIREERR